ncbi:MAG: peptidoglycan DD-metalloendopeptidase family protein [Actinomycetota bacterium]|nr:peptidoglycan DD-metalloendopeptidase family protein [Actinomycetota bacterium]
MTAATTLVAALTAVLVGVLGANGGGVWPLDPRPPVVRGFDPPKASWGAGHRGVDLLGHRGQRVRAAKAGRVTFAGRLAGRGVVVVDHGDVRSTYEPVDAEVHVGDRVGKGQRIGSLQVGGSHCFPRACLHWGLLRGDTYLNPLMLVGGGPVRLLPLTGAPPVAAGPSSARIVSPSAPVGAGSRPRMAVGQVLPSRAPALPEPQDVIRIGCRGGQFV